MSESELAMEWIQIRFEDELAQSLELAARAENVSVGQYIRTALHHATGLPAPDLSFKGPRKPPALKAYLAHDFAYALSWEDLQERLRAKGYLLLERGGRLILATLEGQLLCNASEVDQPYSTLVKRFGALYPNHAHTPHCEIHHTNEFGVLERQPSPIG